MAESQHTQGPWEVVEESRGGKFMIFGPGSRDIVASVSDVMGPACQANAEFIVRACNSHDDLLSVLDEILREVDEAYADGVPLPPWDSRARSAYAKATEE